MHLLVALQPSDSMPQLKEDWCRIRIEEVVSGGIVSYAFLRDAG